MTTARISTWAGGVPTVPCDARGPGVCAGNQHHFLSNTPVRKPYSSSAIVSLGSTNITVGNPYRASYSTVKTETLSGLTDSATSNNPSIDWNWLQYAAGSVNPLPAWETLKTC